MDDIRILAPLSEEDAPSNRLRQVLVTPELVVGLCSGTYRVIANPLPDGYRVRGAAYVHGKNCFAVVVEHASFDEVGEGMEIPEHPSPRVVRVEDRRG